MNRRQAAQNDAANTSCESISQRQHPPRVHQTTRTHLAHVQALALPQNPCNTWQKLLLLQLSTHLQNGDKHVPSNEVSRKLRGFVHFLKLELLILLQLLQRATRRRGLREREEGFL